MKTTQTTMMSTTHNPLLATLEAEAARTRTTLETAKREHAVCVSVAHYAPKGWTGAALHTGRVAGALKRLEAARFAHASAMADVEAFAAILAEGPVA